MRRRTLLRGLAAAGLAAPAAAALGGVSLASLERLRTRLLLEGGVAGMALDGVSTRIRAAARDFAPLVHLSFSSYWDRVQSDPACIDMSFGNPHEMPLPELVRAIQHHAQPLEQTWYAYKMNEPSAREAIRAALRARRGIDYEAEDIFLTNGASAGLLIAVLCVVEPGDEVIYVRPPWFGYVPMIHAVGARAVPVDLRRDDFDLDLDAVARAITPRTRVLLINSPHNPTGKVFPPATLRALGTLLTEASRRNGRPIYLVSDEAYSRIVFDGRAYPSPTEYYPYSFLVYTFSKTLMAPAERLGYLVLPPNMPRRRTMRYAIPLAQIILTGYSFPTAVLRYAIEDLERLTIDVAALQRRRDYLADALRSLGYDLQLPEGTFYLFVRSPVADDAVFCKILAESKVLVLPGWTLDAPGYFRIVLTVTDDMVARSVPAFRAAIGRATA